MVTNSEVFPNLIETHFPLGQKVVNHWFSRKCSDGTMVTGDSFDEKEDFQALYFRFENNPKYLEDENTQLKVFLKSDGCLYVFANMLCVTELQLMFTKAISPDLNLVNFYR